MQNPKLQIPAKLRPFVEKHKRFKVAYGGRGAAKSQSFADIFIMKSHMEGAKVGCFREYQNAIEDSVFPLLVSEIKRLEAPGYKTDKTHIENESGGCFRFKGLARSAGSVKSMFGFKYFWLEEGQFISKESLKILTPTLREEDAECWISMNPLNSADPISQRFIEPYKTILDRDGIYEDDLHLIVKINYLDNPWFPESLDQERIHDFNTLPRAEYDHIWLGAYNDNVEGSIITAEWFDAAVDAHVKLGFKPIGKKIVTFDPSDEGGDDKGLCVRHGSVILDSDSLAVGDAGDGMDWALSRAITEQADLFSWDCDGLGSGQKRQVQDALNGKRVDWAMFKGSESPDNPKSIYEPVDKGVDNAKLKQRTNEQTFRNKRAQYYGLLRDRFYNTYRSVVKGEYVDPKNMISISSECRQIQKLKSEMCRIPKKNNPNGLFQIMAKPDMKKLKLPSPNQADSVMMSLFIPPDKINTAAHNKPIRQSGGWSR